MTGPDGVIMCNLMSTHTHTHAHHVITVSSVKLVMMMVSGN